MIEADFSALERLIGELGKGHYVDVGILGENGGKTEQGGVTLAFIGAVHEFGSLDGHNPERSFIRVPLTTGQEEIEAAVEPLMARKLAAGDVVGIFTDIGSAAEARIQDAFDTGGFGQWPALEEDTIKRKGSAAILIDRGDLRRAITSAAK
jgi:hypothetical protein